MRYLATYGFAFLAMLSTLFGGGGLAKAESFLFSANPNDVTATKIDLATGQNKIVMDAGDGLTRPSELTIDTAGNLYVANVYSPDILKLSQGGLVSIFVSGQGILTDPRGLAFSPQGELFVADSDGRIYRYESQSSNLLLFGDITSADPLFNALEDIEFDSESNLYAASGLNSQGLGAIVKFDPLGNASVFATGLMNPRDLAVDNLGHLYVANMLGEIVDRLDLSDGTIQLFADLSQAPGDPRGIVTDLAKNVYVLNSNGDIRRWNSNGIGGNVAYQSGSQFSEALAFEFVLSYIDVDINIKPGSYSNSINPRSKGKIPVAILSSMDFDAPTEVDTESLTFGPAGDEDSLAFCNSSSEDVNDDGYDDIVCHFYTQMTGFECGDEEGILKGQTVDETPMEGSDSVRIVPSACR